jgi:hypothetical protein
VLIPHPRRAAATLAACALAAAAVTALPPTAAGAATETLAVDFSRSTGAFRGGASGTLYGFGDAGAPTQALINGAHITNSSQKAPYGTQHPSGDALKVEDGFFARHGQELAVYVQDYYPDWPYNGGRRPGDDRTYDLGDGTYTNTPNGVWDYLEVVEFVTEAVATRSAHPRKYLLIPFNEPDLGNWYPDWAQQKDTFLSDWTAAYDTIQKVYARHGLGHARIGGPGDAWWRADRSRDILTHAKADGSVPDVFIWHELGIDNLATFRSHLAEFRAMERRLGVGPLAVNITEYGMLRDMGTPGQLVQWFSMFEDEKVDAQTAYWAYAGNLSDNTARPNGANGGWWLFKWYGDLAGSRTVSVTPPRLDAADTLQGIAAVDPGNRRASVLYGGTGSDVRLSLSGLDRRVFGDRVDVEVRELRTYGPQGLAGTPPVVKVLDGAAVVRGRLELDVPTYDRDSAYQVVVTPEQTRRLAVSPVWTASVEAEDTTVTDACAVRHDHQESGGWTYLPSGGGDVGCIHGASARLDWPVDVPRTGSYRLQVLGNTWSGPPGRHALFVDGHPAGTIQHGGSRGGTYRGSAETTVALTAGRHTLSIRSSADGVTTLPNADIVLDRFTLTDVTDGEPTSYPASTLRYAGGAGLVWSPGVRGFGRVAGRWARADAYVTAMESGYHDLSLRYTSLHATDLRVSVNGRQLATLRAPHAGRWRSTVRVHLAEGINEIELRSAAGLLVDTLTTTRTPAADAAAVTVEAEDATLGGTAVAVTDSPASGTNVSGGGHVEWVGQGEANVVEIPRRAGIDRAGQYDVVVRYANAELGSPHPYNPQVVDRRLDVREVGAAGTAGSAYFRYTHTWNSYSERTIPVTLTTSGGALLLLNPTAWAPNLDRVTIAPAVVGAPSTVRDR